MKLLALGLVLCTGICAPEVAPAAPHPATNSLRFAPQVAVPNAQASRFFSDLKQPDKFQLQMVGSNVLTAKVHFTVVSATGKVLWSEWFPTTQLLGTYGPEPANDDAKKAFIIKRFNTFFAPKSFSARAVKPTATFDADYNAPLAQWQEAKTKKSPGFTYLLGEEAMSTLSYSPSLQKLVVVHRCC
jgi:hypothetical protein